MRNGLSSPDHSEASRVALRRLRLPSANKHIGRPKRDYAKTCSFCGVQFTTKNARQQFCSHSCSVRSRPRRSGRPTRIYVTKKCERCGKEFETFRATQKYCGNACRTACISANMTQITETPCAYCERLFRPPQRVQRFCSKECAYKGKRPSSLVFGKFKLSAGRTVRFESSFELVFLLFASSHPEDFQNIRRCEFLLDYRCGEQQFRYLPDFLCEGRDGKTSLVEVKSERTTHWHPAKTAAKLARARGWCATHGHAFLYLSETEEAFVAMCDYVAQNSGLDVLSHIESVEGLRKIVKYCAKCGRAIPRRGTGLGAYLQRQFCSEKCRDLRGPNPSAQTTACMQCGRSFKAASGHKFCSKACYSESQRFLKNVDCVVCGRSFLPDAASQKACSMACGIILRSAVKKGIPVAEYVEWRAQNRPKPQRKCSVCGMLFASSAAAIQKCGNCRRESKKQWTLKRMVERLTEIRAFLQGRIPTYSEIYDDSVLRSQFNSCSLAGAIYRFNRANHIKSYRDFVRKYLGWNATGKLDRERTQEVLGMLIKQFGGVPAGIGRITNVFGHKGHAFEEAIKAHHGITLANYCKMHGIARISWKSCGCD